MARIGTEWVLCREHLPLDDVDNHNKFLVRIEEHYRYYDDVDVNYVIAEWNDSCTDNYRNMIHDGHRVICYNFDVDWDIDEGQIIEVTHWREIPEVIGVEGEMINFSRITENSYDEWYANGDDKHYYNTKRKTCGFTAEIKNAPQVDLSKEELVAVARYLNQHFSIKQRIEQMTGLYEESFELQGARKLLAKLQGDFCFSMVPCVPMKCVGSCSRQESTDFFPLPVKYRRMAGEGMVRFLLESKDNVRRYLYEDCPICSRAVKDKNGKVVRIDVYTVQHGANEENSQ